MAISLECEIKGLDHLEKTINNICEKLPEKVEKHLEQMLENT